MFDYEQRPNTQEYRDKFDDIFRKDTMRDEDLEAQIKAIREPLSAEASKRFFEANKHLAKGEDEDAGTRA